MQESRHAPPAHRSLRVPPPRRKHGGPAILHALGSFVVRRPDAGRLLLALVLSMLGVALASGGALADVALHRGVETGTELPYVRQVTGRDLATNVDLTRFAPAQLNDVVTLVQANGFRFARQSFAWAEIEPERGAFHWERYDAIVEVLTRHRIAPVAVVHRSPGWARSPEQVAAFDAPPVDPADFERFVAALVGRYGDRVPFVQLWDLPNRADRWGGARVDPGAYTRLLGHGFNAVRAANPAATVILAELDPRPEPGEPGGDLAFLREIYRVGGMPFFHVVAARVDGGDRSPFDRRVDADAAGLSRATLYREVMAEAGDAGKPVWATHYGWRAGKAPGTVDAATQAAFTIAGIERARAEWPWMGPLFTWGLIPGPDLAGTVDGGEALVREDGSVTPLLSALGAFTDAGGTDAAPTGFLPVDARQFVYEGNWALQHLGPQTYRTTSEVGARVTVRFLGTGIIARARWSPQAGEVDATLDGRPLTVDLRSFRAANVDVTLADGLADGAHELVLGLGGPGELTIGGLVVQRAVPLRWPIVLLVGSGLGLLFLGLREMAYTIAERTGRLQRRRGVDLWPELPSLPDWRPSRRA